MQWAKTHGQSQAGVRFYSAAAYRPPEDVAEAAVFLASNRASYITYDFARGWRPAEFDE
ncbi:MAG: hypothetical protein ACTHLX_12980 [Candidatus Binatia bacterium]